MRAAFDPPPCHIRRPLASSSVRHHRIARRLSDKPLSGSHCVPHPERPLHSVPPPVRFLCLLRQFDRQPRRRSPQSPRVFSRRSPCAGRFRCLPRVSLVLWSRQSLNGQPRLSEPKIPTPQNPSTILLTSVRDAPYHPRHLYFRGSSPRHRWHEPAVSSHPFTPDPIQA
jgi:hypothetical protein